MQVAIGMLMNRKKLENVFVVCHVEIQTFQSLFMGCAHIPQWLDLQQL